MILKKFFRTPLLRTLAITDTKSRFRGCPKKTRVDCTQPPVAFYGTAAPHELGWLPVNHICRERWLCLFKKILDGHAPECLIQKLSSLKYNKSYDTRSRLPYRLPIPHTSSKHVFFYNAVKLWNVTIDKDLVCFSSAKNFKRRYFDLIMCKFMPDSFKIDRVF